MGNIKIRNLTAATSADIISGDMVPIALDNAAGLERVTRRATFSQIVSGGSGILAADPNSPFVFNNTTTEQVFQGGLTVPGNITLSGNLNLTGAISGNTTGYFNELYITGSAGEWHQVTTGWSGAAGGGGGTTYTAGSGLTLVGTEFNTAGTGAFNQVSGESGVFTDTLTISGQSVLTGSVGGGGIGNVSSASNTVNYLSKWSAANTLVDSSIFDDGNVGIGATLPSARLHVTGGDGRVLAPSGDFSKALTISGQSVLTGSVGGGGIGNVSSASNTVNYLSKWSAANTLVDSSIFDDGNVGIGATLPSARLHVTGGDGRVLAPSGDFSKALTISGQSVLTGSVGGGGIGNVSSASNTVNYLSKWSAANTLVDSSIFDDGNVGIGATLPSARLHVTGGDGRVLAPSGDFSKALTISGNSVLTGSSSALGKWSDSASAGNIYYNDGDVGIGEVEPSATLHVSGSTIISGSSEITLDYDRLPKANPDIKGRVWIDVSAGFFMVSAGPPPFIISSSQLRMVAAGEYHSLFLTTAGDVYACGWNTNGQLGDGTTTDRHLPTHITGNVSGIAAGYSHSMFISTAGHAYACGNNQYGRLGDGTTVNRDSPTSITGNVMAIAGGEEYSMFLSTAGHAYACGYNDKGQLGDGTTDQKLLPTHITGDVSGISTMENFSMFLSAVGDSYACGYNGFGQLGDDSSVDRHVPTYITGDVTGISAGARLSMFLSTGGNSHACGYGNLGDGNWTSGPQTPTFITGDVTGISAGYDSSRFLSTDNGAYACGANAQGQIGDGTTADKNGFPIHITGDVSGISAGRYTTMFFSTSKDYYACGYNNRGQLGDDTIVNKDVPTYISGQGA